jgi:hypothetical protein
MKKIIILVIFVLINISGTFSQIPYNQEEIFRAMRDEIKRSMIDLKLESLAKPYYVAYTLRLRHSQRVSSVLGSLVDSSSNYFAVLNVELRIGDYKIDNTNFFDVGLGFFGSSDDEEGFKNRNIPFEVSYQNLRRELWLATDAAYKQNSEIYSKKLSAMQNRIRKDTIPDFIKVEPKTSSDIKEIKQIDLSLYSNMCDKISSVFKNYPQIFSSSAGFENLPETIFYANSEGMEYVKTEFYSGVEIVAFTQSKDGMPLANFFTASAKTPVALPSADSLVNAAKLLADNLAKVCVSESLTEPYSGPVLFEGQASGELIAQIFAPNLITQRQPMTEGGFGNEARNFAFQNKIGGRVLPEFMSVYSKPNMEKFDKTQLLGFYKIDDDGLTPQNIDIVKSGYLKNLLSERVPTRRVKASNGSKRGGAAMYSNMIFESEAKFAKPQQELVDRMMKLCKDRELPYGLVVTKIMNQNIMYTTLYRVSNGVFQIPRGDGKLAIAEGYKIYSNGKIELFRGGEINNFSIQNFKDIILTGNKQYVYNFLAPSVVSTFLSNGDQYIGSSIISPELLFEDAEIKSIEDSFPKPPLIENPLTFKK